MSTTQTIHQARRLLTEAESSERAAETYATILGALRALPADDEIAREVIDREIERTTEDLEEHARDADDIRGRIESDLIDQL